MLPLDEKKKRHTNSLQGNGTHNIIYTALMLGLKLED